MEYKIYDHKFEWTGNFLKAKNLIEQAFQELGYIEGHGYSGNGWMVYNHTCRDNLYDGDNVIHDQILFVKPTGPTSDHFAIDDLGYANSSRLAFERPNAPEIMYSHLNPGGRESWDWNKITNLIERKANKYDDHILLKWNKNVRNVPKDHILIVGQMPDDEVIDGFTFKGHWDRLKMIVNKLLPLEEPIVVKLHPAWNRTLKKIRDQAKPTLAKWREDSRIHLVEGYDSIHDYLPHTRVAIIDNSTSGIECLMHEVPVISYGYPEYHWATQRLQCLTQLRDFVTDLRWHDVEYSNKFIYWYINDYLCYDYESTIRRLDDFIKS